MLPSSAGSTNPTTINCNGPIVTTISYSFGCEIRTHYRLNGHSTGRAVLFREISLISGSILACFLLIIMTLLEIELKFSFLAAGVLSLLPLLIVES